MKFLVTLIALALFLAGGGCKRSAKVAPTSSAARPATQVSTVLRIDGQAYTFPAVTLRLRETGGAVNALLRTPPSEDESGNALYFDLTLDDIDGPDAIQFSEWHFEADDNSDRTDSLNGIFLSGRSFVLQPKDVQIGFGADGEQLRATIVGEFFQYGDPDSEKPTKTVSVSGRILLKRTER